MDWTGRLYGTAASLLGTAFELAVIAGTAPAFPRPELCLHCHGYPPVHIHGWTPFIENLGTGDRLSEISRCPGRQDAGTSFLLDHAPLPTAFRPFDYRDTVVACVWVDSEGGVKSVKLVAGTGKAALDGQLLRTIGRQWRFAPMSHLAARPGWQRVRLSNRPPNELY